ncbi:precorrin-6Y C5,15-methyltransferase (decarboxylating) subunit CbiT [Treponema ruminis]|uniref:Precorrin-6y C5,15-methyltransferase (Decarboxylating) CbiE subunit/precorrin-6Y C5,15-methyltransferase (Decarboxylating) CbiT subunit n=1 Tax=Treponema ruminis TaxID=744515 RepID=A0A7W8GBA4_9SPIR|nr:precorrin-6Y C5,15-methyltransferase (decarboxylating) subunit CbiT [Treponema ruminis]MBB5227157.1 precorrin-6y C5,15-methyltransferase (decarboxylating) CbiE subunit/precorrin-6Y C5,15-methyltransferase (decarboxylating) CbiT subunit [Treponema ruminis]
MKSLNLIGLGTGSENFLTDEAKSALCQSEIIFGAERMLEAAEKINPSARRESLYNAREILGFLQENPQYQKISVVFSGDLGFFSGAKSFYEESKNLSGYEINSIPGISSAVYFAAKLHKSWQKWKFLSLHGTKCNAIEQIRKNPACFFILSGGDDYNSLAEKIESAINRGLLSSVKCYAGKNLSYEDEEIRQISCMEVLKSDECQASQSRKDLYVLLVENENAKSERVLSFLDDKFFSRDEKTPMTKKEVRALSIAALGLSESSVLYDIGSGSGSVTVEAARIATDGHIVAVDCKEEAISLTLANVSKFLLENVTLLMGTAPACLENLDSEGKLPLPSHIFIGGSKGNLAEIVEYALKKNPRVRIVANFVSLENLCEMQNLLKALEAHNRIENVEITQLAVSRAEKVGDFHLMKAQNPVYIVSFSGRG